MGSSFSLFPTDNRIRAQLRFVIGIFISMVVALSIAWPVAVMTPIFASMFLSKGSSFFGLKGGLTLLLIAAISCLVGSLVSHYLLHIPIIAISVIALLVFHIFYYASGQGSPFVSLVGLIGVVALPIMAQQTTLVSDVFGQALFFGIGLAVFLTIIMHGLIPDIPEPEAPRAESPKPPPVDARARLRSTYISTTIVLPAVVYFFYHELAGGSLILLLILIMAQNPAIDAGIKGSIAMLLANTIGGLLSIFYYNFLVMVPDFGFLVISMLLAILLFASIIFSNRSYAPLFGSALTTFLLLTYMSTTAQGDGTDVRFVSRITQIGLASIYLVFVSSLVHWLFERRENKTLVSTGIVAHRPENFS